MQVITSIFGKSAAITKDDLSKSVLGILSESSRIEYKESRGRGTEKDKKSLFLKPLVGFLNNFEGGGLLFLGIKAQKGIPTELTGVSTSEFSPQQLRSIIASSLKSIPKVRYPPQIDIIEVPMDTAKSVFLIEIERKEHSTYYSDIDQIVYIRQNDETKSLSLIETLELIEKSICAKVSLKFDKYELHGHNTEFYLFLKNSGSVPGVGVKLMIRISVKEDKKLKISLDGAYVTDVTDIDLGAFKSYSVELSRVTSDSLVYPLIDYSIGRVIIESRGDFEVRIRINTFEIKGVVAQEMVINKKSKDISIEEKSHTYTPYISLF